MKLLVIGKEGRFANNSRPEQLAKVDIVYVPAFAQTDEILAAGRDADCVLVDAMGTMNRETINQMPNLKMIHSEGVGYQFVDTKAAAERGIYVCNCKGMNSTPVAEHAIMLMIGLLRNVVNCNEDVLNGRQIDVKEQFMLEGSLKELADCRIGLVGFGDIAKETARLANAFGAECVYYNRSEVPENQRFGAVPVSLDELLSESDIVSLHLPVTDATKEIVNADFLAKMKTGAFLINTARGGLVNGADLIKAIETGHIGGAGLDCIDPEPVTMDNIFVIAPLSVKKKIIFTPHIAGVTKSSFVRGHQMVWTNIDHIAAGERPERIVNGL